MANYHTRFSILIPDLTDDEAAWASSFDSEEIDEYFDATVDVDDDGLRIYTDESGTPEHAALLIQRFLAEHRPDGVVDFTWANTCDRPREDSFSGGAVRVTATDAQWMNADQWLADLDKPVRAPFPIVLATTDGDTEWAGVCPNCGACAEDNLQVNDTPIRFWRWPEFGGDGVLSFNGHFDTTDDGDDERICCIACGTEWDLPAGGVEYR